MSTTPTPFVTASGENEPTQVLSTSFRRELHRALRELPDHFDAAFFAWAPRPILSHVNFDDTHFAPVIHLVFDEVGHRRFIGLVKLGRPHNRGVYFYERPELPEDP